MCPARNMALQRCLLDSTVLVEYNCQAGMLPISYEHLFNVYDLDI